MNNRTLLFSLCILATACSNGSKDDSGAEAGPDLYSLSLNVTIDAQDGEATFLTPTASSQAFSTQTIIGKPWYVGFFEVGALPGVDPVQAQYWGTVDEDLDFSYTTPAEFENGAHDALFVIYVNTEVPEDEKYGEFPPLALNGDLSSFTLPDQARTEEEPELSVAYLRLKVEDADAEISIRNKTPTDWDDTAQLMDSFIDTVLVVP